METLFSVQVIVKLFFYKLDKSTMLFICVALAKLVMVLVLKSTSVLGITSDEIRLYNHLFNSGYNPELRPVVNYTTVVNVSLGFSMISLGGLDELNQVMKTVGYVETKWTDEHLQWNPSNFSGLDSLIVKPSSVWLPDFVLEDSTTSFYDVTFIRDFRVEVNNDGRLSWEFGGIFKTSCGLDMSLYPFDSHDCALDFQNWMYTGEMVQLYNSTSSVDTTKVGKNGLWKIAGTSVKPTYYSLTEYPGVKFSKVSFVITLKRKPLFYMINLIMPCIFVVTIALVVFWMPAESGEKVSLGITVLLSFLVFLLVIMESTPKNSDNSPILTTFVLSIMAMSTLSVLVSILVLYLHHHPTRQRPPRWVRIIIFRAVACLLFMRRTVPIVPDKEIDDFPPEVDNMEEDKHGFIRPKSRYVTSRLLMKPPMINMKENKVIDNTKQIQVLIHLLQKVVSSMEAKENSDAIFEEWAALARVVDRLFLVLALLYMVAIFAYCFGSVT